MEYESVLLSATCIQWRILALQAVWLHPTRQRGRPMKKTNYSFEKRQRELAKQKKKQEKKLKKQNAKSGESAEAAEAGKENE
ncbi:MAG: hypothetical protein CMQ05_00275 [Gammaproteobacteria bacterium]|nr:hypothetical protein [Gammaproteobacteria bacterium]RPG23360.1 MAG: hypothetical protein CBC10_015165 [Gammaproteobacteria bacterium TMED50]